MSGEINTSMRTEAQEDPPEYSPRSTSDLNFSVVKRSLGEEKESDDMSSDSSQQVYSKLITAELSKCTRCKAHIDVTDYHFGCPKCLEAITCICQGCQARIPNCRIHQQPLIKRIKKPWPALPSWANYLSPTPNKDDNPLIHALKSHNDALITIHAQDPSLLNAHTNLGFTPLHFAAQLGLQSGATILLSYGALTNSRDDTNRTPLIVAIESGQLEIVTLLLQHDVNIHSTGGRHETTALHAAAANGFPSLISLFLEKGAMIDLPSGRGTALQLATYIDSYPCASLLLLKGSNPNARSEIRFGAPPIIWAARNNNPELVELLIKYGADVNLPSLAPTFTCAPKPTKDKQPLTTTALFTAVAYNYLSLARTLLKHGADPNWQGATRTTCLMKASALGNADMCQLLITHGADMDCENNLGMNAIIFAALLGKEKIIDVLLERGASGKPPSVCQGKWKNLEKYAKKVDPDVRARNLKKLRAAKHR